MAGEPTEGATLDTEQSGEQPAPGTASVVAVRIAGIDLARAIAIVGMVTIHIRPTGTGSDLAYVLAVPHGRSAILFAVLAGVGVSLLASSRVTSTSLALWTLTWRAAVLLPLGLWLQTLDHNVLVILADYSLLFLVGIVVLRWADRWVLALAALSLTLGSVAYRYGQLQAPETFDRSPAVFGESAADIVHTLVLSGPYPLITWIAPLCVGVWLGRRDLRAPTVQRWLLLIGGVLAIGIPVGLRVGERLLGRDVPTSGWWPLLADTPHSQRPVWLVSAIAAGIVVLAGCLLLERLAPRAVGWVSGAGQLAFTWYVGHLLVLHVNEDWLRTGSIGGTFAVLAIFTVVMVVVSALWLRWFSRGPLEYALRPPRWRSSGSADDHRGVGDPPSRRS